MTLAPGSGKRAARTPTIDEFVQGMGNFPSLGVSDGQEVRMAGIDTGGSHGGKKPVDSTIPLVPFIDFLLCCVMFLLVTAVWNQLARLDVVSSAGGRVELEVTTPPQTPVVLAVRRTGLDLRTGAELLASLPTSSTADGSLARTLGSFRGQPLEVRAEDGVPYREVVGVLDVALGAGFPGVELAPTAP